MAQRDLYRYFVGWCPFEEQYSAGPLEAEGYVVYGRTPEEALARCRKALWRDLRDSGQELEPFAPDEYPNESLEECRRALRAAEERVGVREEDLLGGVRVYWCDECEEEFFSVDVACEHVKRWFEKRAERSTD